MRYAHTNIAAKDWKALSNFYINVFDCKIKPPERNLSGDWLDRATGLTHAQLEGIHLLLPGHGENGPTLEIFSYKDMIETQPFMANQMGFTHIAFQVDNVKKIFAKALEGGGSPLGKVTERNIKGVGTLTFVYFRDPEGNIIEIQSWR
ncbi:MAG: VOC family protein [Proteobacteria bacterium]|nr:VOC family protein [Pseudomonadota bacterium]MBU1582899.1 VOC family protein [Pseudomonadota bacterium]MBU2452000.1 VOC family protein [Pseudomonadota bacterium]MBU2628114.1 VOC family protein [Pseudomonadota bacterium]